MARWNLAKSLIWHLIKLGFICIFFVYFIGQIEPRKILRTKYLIKLGFIC